MSQTILMYQFQHCGRGMEISRGPKLHKMINWLSHHVHLFPLLTVNQVIVCWSVCEASTKIRLHIFSKLKASMGHNLDQRQDLPVFFHDTWKRILLCSWSIAHSWGYPERDRGWEMTFCIFSSTSRSRFPEWQKMAQVILINISSPTSNIFCDIFVRTCQWSENRCSWISCYYF